MIESIWNDNPLNGSITTTYIASTWACNAGSIEWRFFVFGAWIASLKSSAFSKWDNLWPNRFTTSTNGIWVISSPSTDLMCHPSCTWLSDFIFDFSFYFFPIFWFSQSTEIMAWFLEFWVNQSNEMRFQSKWIRNFNAKKWFLNSKLVGTPNALAGFLLTCVTLPPYGMVFLVDPSPKARDSILWMWIPKGLWLNGTTTSSLVFGSKNVTHMTVEKIKCFKTNEVEIIDDFNLYN